MLLSEFLNLEELGVTWYASEKEYPANKPTPLQLGEFLRTVAQGGPTAASSMFQALKCDLWSRI